MNHLLYRLQLTDVAFLVAAVGAFIFCLAVSYAVVRTVNDDIRKGR